MAAKSTNRSAKWQLYFDIWGELTRRTSRPLRSPSFVIYFVVAVCGLSALGIWMELYFLFLREPLVPIPQAADRGYASQLVSMPPGRDILGPVEASTLSAVRTAIFTFFPAVAGTSAMQLIWAGSTKHFRSGAVLPLFLFPAVALLIFPSRMSDLHAILFGGAMSLFALWVWWIANATHADLLDKVDPVAAVGGDDLQAPLAGSDDAWTVR